MSMLDIWGDDRFPSDGTPEERKAWKERHPNWVQDIVEYWNKLSDKYWR